MYNATAYPRPNKREIKNYIARQDGFYTLHYFVTSDYFDCMSNIGDEVYYNERTFSYKAQILHKYYIHNQKQSFGVITYKLLEFNSTACQSGNCTPDEE